MVLTWASFQTKSKCVQLRKPCQFFSFALRKSENSDWLFLFLFLFSLFFRTVHYYAELGQCSVFQATDAPEQFISQVTVLKYFSHYMEENLMDVSPLAFKKWCLKCGPQSSSICAASTLLEVQHLMLRPVYDSGCLGGGPGTSRPFWPLLTAERRLLEELSAHIAKSS